MIILRFTLKVWSLSTHGRKMEPLQTWSMQSASWLTKEPSLLNRLDNTLALSANLAIVHFVRAPKWKLHALRSPKHLCLQDSVEMLLKPTLTLCANLELVGTWYGLAALTTVLPTEGMLMLEVARLTGSAAQKLKIKSITMDIIITTETTLNEKLSTLF